MRSTVTDLDEALTAVADGSVLATGGAALSRKPIAALRALAARGARELELVTFVGSLDARIAGRRGMPARRAP